MGGKGGPFYVVTDPSDPDPVNPPPGTLRYGVIQEGPLWITFASDMNIRLNEELIVNSFKTIDGRGAVVHIAGGGCITLQYVSNIIIHNVHVHHCVPAGEANVRSSPTHYGWRTHSDGDGISIYSGKQIWIDHCALSYCTDGLIDAIMGSTAITISNNYFSHHNEVMLLGHTDDYLPDSGMQVTIAFNRFGEQLVQRMPRCRRGYFHVVNNDYTAWEMYAIGGSANPTINSQGNRYVTKRVDTAESQWSGWNWRTEGDVLVNGAFFVPSGEGLDAMYAKAESLDPKSATLIDQLTMGAGVLGGGPSLFPDLEHHSSSPIDISLHYQKRTPPMFKLSISYGDGQIIVSWRHVSIYSLFSILMNVELINRDNGDGTGNSVNYGGSATSAGGGDSDGAGVGLGVPGQHVLAKPGKAEVELFKAELSRLRCLGLLGKAETELFEAKTKLSKAKLVKFEAELFEAEIKLFEADARLSEAKAKMY
ncbi:hypothetical protein ZIOFF_064238 [Zingiber officinale]|uniref:Pectate lyase n=1 Tax=Zingiber officinale TaxID=94328 RepID=A0A8J5BMN9_ZINOF|nr:hypothetical protein ZIOFF_064238 [Zingiber officinale]